MDPVNRLKAKIVLVSAAAVLFTGSVSADPLIDALGGINNLIYGIAAGIAALLIALQAIKYKTAAGPAEREEAKRGIINVILGLIILIIAGYVAGFIYYVEPVKTPSTIPKATATTRIYTSTSASATTTTGSPATTTTTAPSACSPAELANKVDGGRIYSFLGKIAKPRAYNTPGNKETANDILNEMKAYSLDNVYFDDFNSGAGRNVVGEVGSGPTTIIVAGGHRDGVSNCPAVVDNGGGTAAIVEAARVLASCKDKITKYKIQFVAFDGEEVGLYGSHSHVSKYGKSTGGMINLDCVGDKNSKGFVVYRSGYGTPLSDSADRACQYLQSNGMTTCKRAGNGAGSDHVSFGNAGIDYVWPMLDNGCGRCYHCMGCEDGMGEADPKQLGWSAKFVVYVLADLYVDK